MTSYNDDEKRKIIMDYYLNKRNRVDEFNDNSFSCVYLHSSSCVDEINLYYNKDFNNFKFVAQGCAIFLSSAEIFIETIIERGFENKKSLIESYRKLVNKENISEEEREFLGKLIIYENVAKHLNRKECALLIANIFEKI